MFWWRLFSVSVCCPVNGETSQVYSLFYANNPSSTSGIFMLPEYLKKRQRESEHLYTKKELITISFSFTVKYRFTFFLDYIILDD